MTRTELALLLFSKLEEQFDGLIHPFGPNGSADYEPGDVVDAIVRVTDPWSKKIADRGGYDE